MASLPGKAQVDRQCARVDLSGRQGGKIRAKVIKG